MDKDDTRVILEGQQILAQQPEISYTQALAQVRRLGETFKVKQSQKRSVRITCKLCFSS